jgi:hypothetical protein
VQLDDKFDQVAAGPGRSSCARWRLASIDADLANPFPQLIGFLGRIRP